MMNMRLTTTWLDRENVGTQDKHAGGTL
jgi:hypothetical protein